MAKLIISVVKGSAAVDLTSDGAIDWADWAGTTGSLTPNQRKSSGGSTITAAKFGTFATLSPYTGDARTVSWSDGTPTASGSNTGGIYDNGGATGTGFEVSYPADTTPRLAKLYTSQFNSNARVTAILSDASVANQVDAATLAGVAGASIDGVVTVTYAAASAGQTLTIRLEYLTDLGGGGNVALQAAAHALAPAAGPVGTVKGAGVAQSTIALGTMSVPMPANAPAAGDLILIVGGTRTSSGGYTTDPTSQGYSLLKQGTGFASGNAIWGKIALGGEGAVNVTPSVNGALAQSFVLAVSGASWPSIGSIVVDSPASGSTNLTNTPKIRMGAVTPSQTNLITMRFSSRLVQSSNTVSAITPSTNFVNVDGSGNPTWGYRDNLPNSHLIATEFRFDGSASTNAVNDAGVTGLTDASTDAHLQIAITLQTALTSAPTGSALSLLGIGR